MQDSGQQSQYEADTINIDYKGITPASGKYFYHVEAKTHLHESNYQTNFEMNQSISKLAN